MTRGFVVAGGLSSRMGRDKARLPYGGGTLLDHALNRLRLVTPDVAVLCGPERRYEEFGAPVVEDVVCGAGALGGLYSALVSAADHRRDKVIWLGVDLPLVRPEFLARLVEELETCDVAMAHSPRGPEPLCGAFQTGVTLEAVRKALLDGRLKLTSAMAGLRLREVPADEAMFLNVNTPAEYDSVVAPGPRDGRGAR